MSKRYNPRVPSTADTSPYNKSPPNKKKYNLRTKKKQDKDKDKKEDDSSDSDDESVIDLQPRQLGTDLHQDEDEGSSVDPSYGEVDSICSDDFDEEGSIRTEDSLGEYLSHHDEVAVDGDADDLILEMI